MKDDTILQEIGEEEFYVFFSIIRNAFFRSCGK
jgi:hypothetical protein